MSLCRLLLLRSLRRYSSSSNPFPFHSPFPASPNQEPQYPNPPSAPNQFYSPVSAAGDASNYHYNPNITPPSAESSNYYHNPQFSNSGAPNQFYSPVSSANTAADASNYHNNPHIPAPSPESSNYYQNPQFSTSAPTNQSQFQTSNTTNSAASNHFQFPISSTTNNAASPASAPFVPQRSYGFSSAEEAAAERRRRKRRLRIEPPLYALRPNPQTPPPNANNPDKPRLPDSTSALVGPRLNLHNRVQSLIRAGDLDSASYVARQSVFQSIRPTVFTCNAIIAAMYRAKRYDDAKALFQYFFRQFNIIPNIVSYNNLIVSHCESSEVEDALKVYEYILENAPYSPSAVTYRHLTKGLIDAGRINDAVDLLREMLHKGHGADSLVYNNVILGFLNLGNLEKANELFDELKERCTVYDGVVNATFMDWFFNQGKPKEAMESYRDLMARNYRMVPATRNVLLETLLRHGKKKEAWDLFHDMLDDHTPPTFQAVNSDTFNMMVNECFKEGKVEEAMDVFKRAGKGVKSKPFQMDVAGFNNMMARLCELEMMDEAEQYYKQLCDKSLSPDVNTYRTLIDAYIKVDRVDNMLEKYTKMVEAGLRVIPPYANKWFGFLIEKGKAADCLPILSKMVDREPKPDVTTYDIVIRGLVKEGNFDATANLVRDMMNQGIGTTASLKEFVLEVFEGLGRRAEIENILNRFPSPYPPQRPFLGQRGPPRVVRPPEMVEQGVRNPAMPWQTSSPQQMSFPNQFTQQTYQPQMTEHVARPHPMPEQEAEFPRVAGQSAS
ncbi:Pentatricopeptide repeat-containing protein [Sesamum alatum]|uniref:Pentatricopeptide repeat-containing protein n=1 Tax=Sesamum alatum TaxID=300844 RepID=A0AAE2CJP5_9LAMI|nr:Pentatricopeptide repeat-containing protein [Sesamum alatum]